MEGLELDPWMIEAIKNANPLFLESAVDVRCAPPVEGDFWSKCVEVVSEVNNGMIGRYSNKCMWISVAHGYGKLTGNDVCPTVLIEMSVDRIADHDIFDNVKHTSVLRELEDHLGVNIVVLSGRKKDDKWYVVPPKNMRQRNTIFVLDNWDSCHFQCVTAFICRDGKRITVPVPDWKIEIQSVRVPGVRLSARVPSTDWRRALADEQPAPAPIMNVILNVNKPVMNVVSRPVVDIPSVPETVNIQNISTTFSQKSALVGLACVPAVAVLFAFIPVLACILFLVIALTSAFTVFHYTTRTAPEMNKVINSVLILTMIIALVIMLSIPVRWTHI